MEVSALPIGTAVGCINQFAGSVSYIDIFYQMQDIHNSKFRKVGRENEITDTGVLEDFYPESRAVLANKGYHAPRNL